MTVKDITTTVEAGGRLVRVTLDPAVTGGEVVYVARAEAAS